MSQPILLMFGVGKNIGAATVHTFSSSGYKVAQATRSADPTKSDATNLYIRADTLSPKSVSEAFTTVRKTWGEPNIILFNAYVSHFGDLKDPFGSVSTEEFASDLTGNVTSTFVGLNEALVSFRKLPSEATKVFMVTGNLFNEQTPLPGQPMLTLGVGKSAVAYMLAEADSVNKDTDYKFYYVDERDEQGGSSPGVMSGGQTHAQGHADFFLELAKGATDVPWQATFVAGKGYKKFPKK